MEGRRGEHHGGQRQPRGQGRRGRVGSGRFQHSPERSERPSSSNVDHRQRTGNNSRHQNTQNWRQPSREGDQQRHNQNNPAAQRNLSRRQQNSEDGNEQIRHKYNPFSYHNLKKLATEESNNDVVKILANSDYNLEGFIQGEVRLDFFHFIIKALAKVCQSDFDESKLKILGIVCESTSFLDSFMSKIMQDEKTPQERKELVCNILTISETVAQCMPLTACDKLLNIIQGCKYCCMGLQGKLSLDELTFKRFEDFSVALTEKKSKVLDTNMQLKIESRNERLQKLQPPNDFRTMSAAPTSEDVLCRNDAVFLRPNLVRGKYDSIEHYLDVQFRLLREDFVRPLREGIAAYISGDKKLMQNSSVRLHKDVVFIRSDDKTVNANNPRNKDVEGVLVQFEDPKKKKKKTDWEHTRRFMFGSLLCFSKDNFRTLLISTVSDRDLKNLEKGLLRVVFSKEVEENIYHQKYTMVESEVFFEPYFHVLKTLQSLEESTFPLPEYLIHVQEDDFPPAYLEPKPNTPTVIYNLPVGNQEWPLIVTNNQSWPSPRELGLDNSQWLSLHAALTRELVVIQGPPGTGKTYMGLRIAEILIKNKLQTGRQSPILVVCLTNHALDQFLVDILKFTRKIIRIGGQSKCDELMNYNLRVLKRQTKSRDQMKLMINLKEEIRTLQFEVSEFDSSIAAIKSKPGIVAYEMFCRVGVIPKYFHNIFSNNRSCFNKWLMEDRIENGRNLLEEISQVQYCFLMEEFDKSIESLENKKFAEHSTLNVHELYDIQQQLQADKEWLEGCLNSEEIATKEQCDHWVKNIWKLHIYQKWQLYHYFLRQLEDRFLEEIRIRENEILKKNNELSELQIVDDLEILREADVVGMTTTGAARLHKLLRKLGPEIVIVEEAAEVMESHVVACLTEKCCHLILIGDHKQLRPQIATYELEKKYNFHVSLFERMVNNREKCILTLEVQHRMAPEIAQLITPSIYPALKNADKVKNYPEIIGVPKRLFFIDHSNQEEMVDLDSNSRINRFEANFIIALCRHLILQGYDSSKITILTTYRGQMFHIRKLMKGMESLKGVLAQVVDNYQGEENDIILLSLVRSNPERRIGFLATENRVCVALSRAKHALYIVGDMSCLSEADKVPAEKNIWIKIKDTLKKQNAIGKALTLKCDIHPEQVFTVSTGPEFSINAPEGGCRQLCRSQLLCTHPCNRVCHVLQRDHVNMKCQSPCLRFCDSNLHLCKKKCYESCGDCMVDVEKTLACGHKVTLQCHVDPNTINCNEIVLKTFKPCNHQAEVKCHIDPHSTCPCDCDHRLPCGHSCIQKCHFNEDHDHLLYVCKKPCGRRNAGCSMNHECGKRCCDECAECIVKVPKKLKCGHDHYVKCSEDIEMIECNENCTRTLICGHKCKRKCKDYCNPCLEKVKKRSTCGHAIVVDCGIIPDRTYCDNKCKLQLPCGHPCTSTCNKPCTAKCLVEMYTVKGACGHQVPLLCWEQQQGLTVPSSTSRCSQTCPAILDCGHMCSGTCGTCYQGRFHSLCDMPCGRVLVCGHPCKQPCAVMCPPCEEKCSFFCNHSKCPKKCGEPCAPCKERCQWQCEHKTCKRRCGEICDRDPCDEPCPKRLKCGHDCISFCGEPCPKLCRSCNADEVTDIFFGTEDEPDARFINLVDCGHSIEVEGMKNWMAQNDDMVSKKSCPKCTKTISRSLRFGNDIKQSFFDICKVKKRLFGDARTIEEKRKELETKVEGLLQECTSDSQEYDELRWFLDETLKSLGYTVGKRRNVLSSSSIRCKEIEVDIVSRVCEVWQKSAKLGRERREELQTHMNLILDNLEAKKHRLSQQQVIDFELEILRLQNILQYHLFQIQALTRPDIQYLLGKSKAVISDFTKRYSIEKNEAAHNLFKEIKTELNKTLPGLGITEFERRNIVQALQLSQGHWFKCPNGHPYIIADCGGAMQESKCNECGATIGGGSHRLRSDNSHFGLIDGSTHAAWSEQANLANYRFL